MRTGPAAGFHGYFHEAFCYDSDEEFLAVAVPFLLDGVAAGEPTLVTLGDRTTELIRAALPAEPGVTFLTGAGLYDRPSAAIRSYQELLASLTTDGGPQIRIIGEMPAVFMGVTWDWWARYESTINHAYDGYPLWGICAYDRRTTPAAVLADVARTHPHLVGADGRHLPNGTYTDPLTYLGADRPVVPDPLQLTAALVELTDPSPAQARRAVYDADQGNLSGDEVEDLVVAVSEVVTNALRHGQPPVRFRLWTGADRIVVTVSDGGAGPKEPFAGLLPVDDGAPGGLGLWISYQSCNHVASYHTPEGFTLRLTAGNPHFSDLAPDRPQLVA
ncbi:sensor histidine kinase [Micromonospora echinofusca]|uniref:Sensor histidine kinase n=1 Tax=Micromonospora echinofusca TaxID=47858 RepID=A0ABS3VTU8_MICEH|nr:sensor histidine kinase [Micromonospora echinofusca]MBO4207962.1 sensor histidine kinase [Micromonospora echinofusca]